MITYHVSSAVPRIAMAAALVFLSTFAAQDASAQINSNASTVALNAVMAETLGITASPSIVNFTLAPGSTAAGSAPVVVSSSNTLGAANGGLKLYTQIMSSTNRESSRSDSVSLQINLTSQPQLPAGTYTGTLNIQAQAL